MRVLSLFIASPGGVDEERHAVELQVSALTATLGRVHNIAITTRRYEQLIGAAGNPQAQINVQADDSDIFVGIVYRRWGSDTGNGFDSGFHEEFTQALERWTATGSPRIALFFKEVDAESLTDPGTQLTRVLEFRRKVETEHIAFYNQFATTPDLTTKVTALVAEELARASQAVRAPEGQGASTSVVPAARPPATHEPISEELAGVVRAFSDTLGGHEPAVSLDVDRLELFALAISADADHLPTHLANRLYARRASLGLIYAERRIWLREYLRDIGRSAKAEDRVIPFASLVGREWIGQELTASAGAFVKDDDRDLRIGTLRLLGKLQLRPAGVWPGPADASGALELQQLWGNLTDLWSRKDVIRYWLSVQKKRDVRRARALAAADGDTGQLGKALLGLLQEQPDASSTVQLDAELLVDPLVRARFADGRPERTLPEEQLTRLFQRSYLSADVRALALAELADRDAVPAAVIEGLFTMKTPTPWTMRVDKILLDRAPGPNLRRDLLAGVQAGASVGRPNDRFQRSGDILAMLARHDAGIDEVLNILMPTSETFDETRLRWQLIRLQGDPSGKAMAHAILKRTDTNYQAFEARMLTDDWKPTTRKFMQDTIAVSVLFYLLSLPDPKDDRVLTESVRALAADENSLAHRTAMHLLARVARDADLPVLIQYMFVLDDSEQIMRDVLQHATLQRLRRLAHEDSERLAGLALQELSRRERPLPGSQLRQLLRSPIATVRLLAAEQLAQNLDTTQLASLADGYIQGSGTHYYNVLSYLDDRLAGLTS